MSENSTNHCMLDLETLGTGRDAQIVSVGAVAFGAGGVAAEQAFYRRVKLPESVYVQSSTLEWWLKQSEAVRAELYKPDDRSNITDVCVEFAEWWKQRGCRYVWSHGAGFDVPMLELHFLKFLHTDLRTMEQCTEDTKPWHYADVRDTRTLYQLAGVDVKGYRAAGTAHNALDDAVAQARAACEAVSRLGVDWARL